MEEEWDLFQHAMKDEAKVGDWLGTLVFVCAYFVRRGILQGYEL